MPFDFAPDISRSATGLTAYHDGLAAEDSVAHDYRSRGYNPVAQRWRGRCGEIDLIFERAGEYVFVEVKKARTLDIAASRLTPRQLGRIARSAEDYIGSVAPDPLTPMRLDLAMVDQSGKVAILENLMLD
ncbi:MAG: YraN family protein [Silicimonas sp.]|jgi:putative endonuclease|nr:YraN family protein [Silicimonas sp.]